jgi:hypothetical protein
MTADQKHWRRMLIGMALIIGFSGAMHVYLIRKGALQENRYEPSYGDQPEKPGEALLQGGGTRTGDVIAVSYDKFFLRIDDKVQPFLLGNLPMPDVGERVTVSFAGGRPPQAVDIVPARGAEPAATAPGEHGPTVQSAASAASPAPAPAPALPPASPTTASTATKP